MPDDPNQLDPATFYSPRDVLLRLNISRNAQRQARLAGELRFAELLGGGVIYRGAWVLSWLNRLAGTGGGGES
mgnify:CR=1 FL=1